MNAVIGLAVAASIVLASAIVAEWAYNRVTRGR